MKDQNLQEIEEVVAGLSQTPLPEPTIEGPLFPKSAD